MEIPGVFFGPQVKQLFKDPAFKNKLNSVERRPWDACENVCCKFLGNEKSENCVDLVGGATFLITCLGVQHVVQIAFPAVPLRFLTRLRRAR